MNLTTRNYYTPKANREFMSVSQYKDFLKCEAMAMAKIKGEYAEDFSRPLLLGSLVDCMLTEPTQTQQAFERKHHDELFKKNGEPYADVSQALNTVADITDKQPLMMEYLNGKHQVIMTGTIADIPWKIRIDSLHPDKIVDLKYMSTFKSPNMFQPFVEYWGYHTQGAVYQEIVRQNIGERLPFYLVVATKETPSRKGILQIDNATLSEELDKVIRLAPHFYDVKREIVEPERCNRKGCDYCSATEIITKPINYLEVEI